MTERGEMEAVIEAVLFVASEPVPRQRLLELFDEEERAAAEEALATVLARFGGVSPSGQPGEPGEPEQPAGSAEDPMSGNRGVMVEEVAGGIRLVTRPELVHWLRRFFEVSGGTKLSMAALETLAIIAYRQPVTAPEIQELRSVNPTGVIGTLLQRRLVRIAGRKEVVGKPFLYATTREFLVHFGLKSLKDLPPLEEFEQTFGDGAGGGSEGTLGGADREEQILIEAAALEEREQAEAEEGGEIAAAAETADETADEIAAQVEEAEVEAEVESEVEAEVP